MRKWSQMLSEYDTIPSFLDCGSDPPLYWVRFRGGREVEYGIPPPPGRPKTETEWVPIWTKCDDTKRGKLLAQSHLFWRITVDFKPQTNCPVCSKVLTPTEEETIESIPVKYKRDCECGLYHDHFDAGVRQHRVGYATFDSSWQEEEPKKWEEYEGVLAEAKRIAEYRSYPEHGTPLMIVGGWLEDADEFPLQRANVEAQINAPVA